MKNLRDFKNFSLKEFDSLLIEKLNSWSLPVLRVSLGIVFIWFGALKPFGDSPANEVVLGEEEVQKISNKITTRKSQALLSIITMIVFFLVVFGVRYYMGCESINSFISSGLFIYFGTLWYNLLSKVGEDRLSDLFGIANRLLPPSAIKNDPIACVPIRK